MLNLNSALRAAGEPGAQELMNLTQLKFVPICQPRSTNGLRQEWADLAELAGCTPKLAYREGAWF